MRGVGGVHNCFLVGILLFFLVRSPFKILEPYNNIWISPIVPPNTFSSLNPNIFVTPCWAEGPACEDPHRRQRKFLYVHINANCGYCPHIIFRGNPVCFIENQTSDKYTDSSKCRLQFKNNVYFENAISARYRSVRGGFKKIIARLWRSWNHLSILYTIS